MTNDRGMVLDTLDAFQLATRAFTLAVAVKQDRQHDLGMMRLLALPVDPVRRVKRRQTKATKVANDCEMGILGSCPS